MGQQRLRKSSAVNLALPPVPNPAAPARGFELFYDDVGGPPTEDAPIPPQPLSPTRGETFEQANAFCIPYEGLNVMTQMCRKCGVFCLKLEGSHSPFY